MSFIKRLRPVTYYFDIHKQNEIVYKDVEIGDWEGKYDLENELQTGFIAQEVAEAARFSGYDFNG
ncbi:MAG: tail fiber domain-containing protein [Flavobacterium sp.]|nr:tail fiber domain-containing protein [Flavobacterium sp.]